MHSMMVAIQHLIQNSNQDLSSEVKEFLESASRHLARTSGKQLQFESWEISSFEVDFEESIGQGGFGEVFKGVWNHCPVALKVLKDEGFTPRAASINFKNEIKVYMCLVTDMCERFLSDRCLKIWQSLRHPNVLRKTLFLLSYHYSTFPEFLGANTMDDSPFIVMPFMENGNATDYIEANPHF
jgi:serine/threonine protein kinase